MEQTNIIEKIKKLLALASSPNPHEAALAMEKATALLAKHNLSYAQLETKEKIDMGCAVRPMGKRIPTWKQNLFSCVTNTLDCVPILEKSYTGQSYKIIGHPADVAIARDLFENLLHIVDMMGSVYAGNKNSYRMGIIRTINDRLTAMYSQMTKEATTALVCVQKKKRVEAYVDSLGDFKTKKTRKTNADVLSFMAGLAAGKNVALNRSIGHQPTECLT